MPDIRVIKGKYTAKLQSLTERGTRWIKSNKTSIRGEVTLVISNEFVQDVIIEMERDGLVIDETR